MQTDQYFKMVDNLPPYIENTPTDMVFIALVVVFVVVIGFVIKRNPYAFLLWKLKYNKITPRQALHLLAKNKPFKNHKMVDSLRFKQVEPSKKQVIELLKNRQKNG